MIYSRPTKTQRHHSAKKKTVVGKKRGSNRAVEVECLKSETGREADPSEYVGIGEQPIPFVPFARSLEIVLGAVNKRQKKASDLVMRVSKAR